MGNPAFLLILVLTPASVCAQSVQLFPRWPAQARIGWADALETRNAIGILRTDLLRDSLARRGGRVTGAPARELQGVVSLAADLGVLERGRFVLGLSGGLIARFRLEQPDNDALSSDYLVAFPITYSGERFGVRIRPMHRSGHLGDEVVLKSGVERRLEYDHEEVDAVVSARLGWLRPYLGGSLTVASSYGEDTGALRAGFDAHHDFSPGRGLVGGVDWQSTGISGWTPRISAALGTRLERSGRGVVVLLRQACGGSSIGEFFADRERYWGLEIVLRP
jgi:hypothetical protein